MKRLRPVDTAKPGPIAARKRGYLETLLSGRAQPRSANAGLRAPRFKSRAMPDSISMQPNCRPGFSARA